MEEHFLAQTEDFLKGPSKEQVTFHNQWAAMALDNFHLNSKTGYQFSIDGTEKQIILKWDSDFPKAAMKEKVDMANHGGVAIAWFLMAVLLEFKYVEQSEIGEGVDYLFMKTEPDEDDLNFLDNHHHVEVSGIMEEKGTNTLAKRIKEKHLQIDKGIRGDLKSSVIVTLFEEPKTIKELHN